MDYILFLVIAGVLVYLLNLLILPFIEKRLNRFALVRFLKLVEQGKIGMGEESAEKLSQMLVKNGNSIEHRPK